MKTINVIGIIHKDAGTPYGISFPGLPDPVFELSDDCGPGFASEISNLLKEYFSHLLGANTPVQMDPGRQAAALSEAAEDPSWAGYTKSTVTIDRTDVTVSTTLHPVDTASETHAETAMT